MQPDIALLWSWLGILTKKRYDALISQFGNLEQAAAHIDPELLKALGCREETIFKTIDRLENFDPDSYQSELKKRDLSLISIEDETFPASLKTIPDPPVFLVYRGDLSLCRQPCIALVGTREMSAYGQRVAEVATQTLLRASVVPVSGLAKGIDAAVARETITGGGRTIAVLGHGLAVIHPKEHARLADDIVAEGGLLLSEYPLDMPPDKFTFPARNRIIAGLSLATVVLEAGEGSGALITAELALDYGRDVLAVPGQLFDPNFAGCHRLISSGQARLVAQPDDILAEVGIIAPAAPAASRYTPANENEQMLLDVLSSMPQSVSELSERITLSPAEINGVLTMLELAGAVKNAGNGTWVHQ